MALRPSRISRLEAGQAAVESALVMPLFVFLILGTLQLSMMHQARLMTKYAAYKAVREGSLNNAKKERMLAAAISALIPVIGMRGAGDNDYIPKSAGPADYAAKWALIYKNGADPMPDASGLNYVDVQTCGPTQGRLPSKPEVDFDDPAMFADSWSKSTRTKLSAQVTLNYRLVIPFANRIIHSIYENKVTPMVLRLGKDGNDPKKVVTIDQRILDAADHGVFVVPIRATYTMRMQSNPYTAELPEGTKNPCKFSFNYDE